MIEYHYAWWQFGGEPTYAAMFWRPFGLFAMLVGLAFIKAALWHLLAPWPMLRERLYRKRSWAEAFAQQGSEEWYKHHPGAR